MNVCIHRGTHEIGGTCIELESAGFRILLDLGLPLDSADAVPLPAVRGLSEPTQRYSPSSSPTATATTGA